MADFDKAYNFTRKYEGGYVDHPNDKGGETYAGISSTYHSDWPGWAIVEQLKDQYKSEFSDQSYMTEWLTEALRVSDDAQDLVREFYYNEFWYAGHLDLIMDDKVAMKVYDLCVWRGVGSASKMLQEAVGTRQDGNIGPITAAFVNRENSDILCGKLTDLMLTHINKTCKKDPTQEVFRNGWERRARAI